MASPVGGVNQGNGEQALVGRIRMIVQQELANAARGGIGLHVDGATGNLIIDNNEIQSGNYVAGSSGWGMFGNGNAEFNAITLRSGIIGNDALANPVTFGRTGGAVTNFAVPTTATAINSQTIAVPAGYSQAIVFVVTNCTIYSLSTSTAGVYLKAAIGSVTMTNATSNALDPVNGFNWAPMGSSATATLTGLSGGSISVLGCMSSTNALPADTHNVLNLDAIAIFLR